MVNKRQEGRFKFKENLVYGKGKNTTYKPNKMATRTISTRTKRMVNLYPLPFKCKLNPRTKYFQFQILHRSLITNKNLLHVQYNLTDHETCDFCGDIENISHLLYACPTVKNIWENTESWLKKYYGHKIKMDKNSIILGNS